MLFSVYGIPTYAIAQLAALVLFAVLVIVLFRRSGLSLLHAVTVIVLYMLCNFLVAKLLFDYVKAGGRHTLFMHPSLEHFTEGGFGGWPIAFLPAVLAVLGLLLFGWGLWYRLVRAPQPAVPAEASP
jgi:hypothetical protein